MKPGIIRVTFILSLVLVMMLGGNAFAAEKKGMDYENARWDPIHFKPAIDSASNEQCLACHQEVLESKVRKTSPAGVAATDALAWYQTLNTYDGKQESFHRRHLATPLAAELMDMKCNTCHQGNNPREEAVVPPDHANTDFTLRKMVNPEICLMCHGRNPYEIMGLPKPWAESAAMFQDNCLLCHAAIRSTRHQVNFLKADAIEKAGAKDSDVCYGCHGGRTWYRIEFPYPRHAWPGMSTVVPEWAKNRPTESAPRFRKQQAQATK